MKIICVGRNYAAHASELGNALPSEPVLFTKPDTAILLKRNPFFIPDFSDDVHHEIELVVRINRVGKNIQARYAKKYYNQITVGVDFTARDLQQKLKENGLPWEKAKAFDGSAVVGKWEDLQEGDDVQNMEIALRKNGEVVQAANTSLMLNSVDALIAEISRYFTLKIGDLIFTGTPAGVSRVQAGDTLEGFLQAKSLFKIDVK